MQHLAFAPALHIVDDRCAAIDAVVVIEHHTGVKPLAVDHEEFHSVCVVYSAVMIGAFGHFGRVAVLDTWP